LEQAHPDDKTELANLLGKATDRNTGVSTGTGSRPPDLTSAVATAIQEDAVVADTTDGGGGEEAELSEPGEPSTAPDEAGPVTASGVKDPTFGDGRVPTEINWGIQDLPERVQENALAFVVRRGPRTNVQQPRLDFSTVKKLAWILGIRRALFMQYDRSPVPGSIMLLAPHYKQGLEGMYSDLALVTRLVTPGPSGPG
jgi:hypothetical protein